MKFSIVVPTYNEENDIAGTLDALVALDYPDKETVVVDDSTDSTPTIVGRYAAQDVRLVRPARREGRCGARNLGIMEATGDIVVILNADVRPRKDFLRRLAPHYEQDGDYVLVNAEVANNDDLFARYVDAMAAVDESSDPSWMEWTEGFSCRRDLAIRAGMFPTGFAVPICAGEDGFFGTNLKNLGAKKIIDFTITVDHVAPASFSEYWKDPQGGGARQPADTPFSSEMADRYDRRLGAAALREDPGLCRLGRACGLCHVARDPAFKKGIRDLAPFLWAWLVEQAAFHVASGSPFSRSGAPRNACRSAAHEDHHVMQRAFLHFRSGPPAAAPRGAAPVHQRLPQMDDAALGDSGRESGGARGQRVCWAGCCDGCPIPGARSSKVAW